MSFPLHTVMLVVHVLLGLGGFVLGGLALILPKFGARSRGHRLVGRAYAVSMLGMSLLSVPLAASQGNVLLLVIGVLTVLWVALGWGALFQFLRARARGQPETAGRWLGGHINLMGSSYIAAWTAFLVNVEPLGTHPALVTAYVALPSLVGSVLIARAIRRQGRVSALA